MTLCSCGLDMQQRGKALMCDHCDVGRVHVTSTCIRCQRLMPAPRRP